MKAKTSAYVVAQGLAFVAVLALVSVPLGSPARTTSTSQSSAAVNTILVRVVNSTSGQPIADEAVLAGPVSSATDLVSTVDGETTLSECVHTVANGSAVFPSGGFVVSNNTTTTLAPCPIMEYYTNATGWVTIPDQNATNFLVEPGTLLGGGFNAQVVAIQGSQTYVIAPFPEGNFTVSRCATYSPTCG